jgi:hypothetical protein
VSSEPGAAVPPTRPDGFLARIYGVVRHPRATFTQVAAAPGWIGLLAALTLATAGSRVAVLETQVGQQALVDEWERTAFAFGQDVDDVRYAELQALSSHAWAYGLGLAILNGPVLALVVAGGIYVMFGRSHVKQASFNQVCTVVVLATVPLVLRQIIAAAATYVTESTASATSIGSWWSTLDEASGVARFVGALDLFVIWWVVVLAIGVGVLYQRSARRLAFTFLAAYAGLALVLAGTMVALSRSA